MFTPIHLLPRFDVAKQDAYERRWNHEEGIKLQNKIMEMIRQGAGEDFLQSDFEHGRLGFIENVQDLKGFTIFQETVDFPDGDTFEGTDFSYAKFYHSTFRHGAFSWNCEFTKIYNCQFVNCIFSFSGMYGAMLEKVKFINCEFVERNSFTNCVFQEVEFRDCFIPKSIFSDCHFDENTIIGNLLEEPTRFKPSGLVLEKNQLASIYRGIKDGFRAGGVLRTQHYYFRQMQSETRFNSAGIGSKCSGYFLEYVAGYGVRPVRVLLAMAIVFLTSLACFSCAVGFSDALLLVSGALFTFGANAELLRRVGISYKLLYIATSFCGIGLVALFITVLASKWLREM